MLLTVFCFVLRYPYRLNVYIPTSNLRYEPLQGTKFDEDPSNYLLQVEGAGNPVVDGCYQYSQETNYQHYHSTPQWAQVDN